MLFEKLVEQHRVDLLVMDAHDFTIRARNQLGIDLRDLLADQPYCFVPFQPLLYLNVTDVSRYSVSLAPMNC